MRIHFSKAHNAEKSLIASYMHKGKLNAQNHRSANINSTPRDSRQEYYKKTMRLRSVFDQALNL